MTEKKPRKKRSDAGKKRGKRIKNPRLQTGSIDFRTIGTNYTMGPNLTSLIGTMSALARPVPQQQYLQPQISTELAAYMPRDLPKNVPPPQFKPDVEQSQEENIKSTMGKRINRLRHEEASLYLKNKVSEARNIKLEEKKYELQNELQQSSKKILQQQEELDLDKKNHLVHQIYSTNNANGYSRLKSKLTGVNFTGKELKDELDEYGQEGVREMLLSYVGINPALVDFREIKTGERGKSRKDYFYNPQKQDLQRGQEEITAEEFYGLKETEPKILSDISGYTQIGEDMSHEEYINLLTRIEEDALKEAEKAQQEYESEVIEFRKYQQAQQELVNKKQQEYKQEEDDERPILQNIFNEPKIAPPLPPRTSHSRARPSQSMSRGTTLGRINEEFQSITPDDSYAREEMIKLIEKNAEKKAEEFKPDLTQVAEVELAAKNVEKYLAENSRLLGRKNEQEKKIADRKSKK